MLSDNFTLGVALLEGQSISGALNEYGRKFFRILMVNDLFHFYGDIWSV